MNPQITRRTIALAVGLATAGTALLWTRSRRKDSAKKSNHHSVTEPVVATNKRASNRRPSAWAAVAISFALTIAAAIGKIFDHSILAAASLLVALTISAVILRGRSAHSGRKVMAAGFATFSIQIIAAFGTTATTINGASDALTLLEATLFGIIFFGILMSWAVSWLRPWRFAEPVCLGLVGLALGVLCVPGLQLASQEAESPFVTGAALLFSTGQPDQKLNLTVAVYGIGNETQTESFQIVNSSDKPIHWALVLVNGARISGKQTFGYRAINFETSNSNLGNSVQLFSGYLRPGDFAPLEGYAVQNFSDSAGAQTAVSLPLYGEGASSDLGQPGLKMVTNALGSPPVSRNPGDFTAQIDSGPMYTFDSVTSENLVSTASQNLIGDLEWVIHGAESIDYSTLNQQSEDTINNLLFAFAILLGVAGAAVLASIQGAIHISATDQKSDD